MQAGASREGSLEVTRRILTCATMSVLALGACLALAGCDKAKPRHPPPDPFAQPQPAPPPASPAPTPAAH